MEQLRKFESQGQTQEVVIRIVTDKDYETTVYFKNRKEDVWKKYEQFPKTFKSKDDLEVEVLNFIKKHNFKEVK